MTSRLHAFVLWFVLAVLVAKGEEKPSEDTSADSVERGPHLCPRGIGAAVHWPSSPDHLKGPRPPEYDYLIPIAGSCALLCACISLPFLSGLASASSASIDALSNSGKTTRNWPAIWMVTAAAAPCAISAVKLMAVLAPRLWKLLFLLAACYEVIAFWCFKKLIFSFIGETDEEILSKFADTHATKLWAVPPFACFFRPCVGESHFNARDLAAVNFLMWQFMVFCPFAALIEMTEELPHELHIFLWRAEIASLLFAMYGLFALLMATHDMLPARKLHSKFWTLKGIFIASTAVFRFYCEITPEDVRVGDRCYTSEAIAAARAGATTAVLAVPLSILAWYAFSKEDLEGKQE